MNNNNELRPTLKVQTGEDGNPKVYVQGTPLEIAVLCAAAVAAVCIDPAGALISIMTVAADLMDRMEEVHHEEA